MSYLWHMSKKDAFILPTFCARPILWFQFRHQKGGFRGVANKGEPQIFSRDKSLLIVWVTIPEMWYFLSSATSLLEKAFSNWNWRKDFSSGVPGSRGGLGMINSVVPVPSQMWKNGRKSKLKNGLEKWNPSLDGISCNSLMYGYEHGPWILV